MRQLGPPPFRFALGLLLLAGPPAFADPVSWSYSLSTSTGSIAADGGSDTISLSPTPAGTFTGPGNLNLLGFSTLTPDPLGERFTNRSYSLTLNLTDNDLNKSGSLVFGGTLDGSLAPATDGVTVGFDRLKGALDLGSHRFDVTLSARFDRWSSYDAHNLEVAVPSGVPTANNNPSLPERQYSAVSPHAAAMYHLSDRVSAWGGGGWGFRAPTRFSSPN